MIGGGGWRADLAAAAAPRHALKLTARMLGDGREAPGTCSPLMWHSYVGEVWRIAGVWQARPEEGGTSMARTASLEGSWGSPPQMPPSPSSSARKVGWRERVDDDMSARSRI